jgi:hypothetical protein
VGRQIGLSIAHDSASRTSLVYVAFCITFIGFIRGAAESPKAERELQMYIQVLVGYLCARV